MEKQQQERNNNKKGIMAKDPSTTRIPRLDGISRIPPPGSFSGVTSSHIRPPTAIGSGTGAGTASGIGTVLKRNTQIFRTPALPANNIKPRPISSYHATAAPLHDLGANIKKSSSGERLNNAVSLISKRTTNVLRKYFAHSKILSPSGGSASSPAPAEAATASLPQTPLPAKLQMSSSTPMPLMRSDTFVCDVEKDETVQEALPSLETTRLSIVGFPRNLDLNATCVKVNLTRTIIADQEQGQGQLLSPLSSTRSMEEQGFYPNDATQVLKRREQSSSQDRTRVVNPNVTHILDSRNKTMVYMPHSEEQGSVANDATQILSRKEQSSSQDKTRIINPDVTHILDRNRTRGEQSFSNDTTQILTSSQNRTISVVSPSEESIDEEQSSPNDATHILNSRNCSKNRTRPVITDNSMSIDTTHILRDRTRLVISTGEERGLLTNRNRPIIDPESSQNLIQSLDLTKSMDQLPLLEHMSMPSGLDMLSAQPEAVQLNDTELDTTLTPDKSTMKLPLNSTINTERLLDLTGLESPARHLQLMNLTREFLEQTPQRLSAAGRRSIAQQLLMHLTPQSATTTPHGARFQRTPVPVHLLSPLLKAARSDLVLPTRTPEGDLPSMDDTLKAVQQRYSFGLDLADVTLDSSIELVDNSFSSSQQQLQQLQQLQQQLLKRQHSIDLDESLGILTPDQMHEFLDSSLQQLQQQHQQQQQQQQHQHQQHQQQHLQLQQQLRLEQTPSPEELPLDPIEPQLVTVAAAAATVVPVLPPATVAAASSNSFITSVTSVTSLDTGYQGDGEMSRPASRGACDHSPSNGPHLGRVSRQPSFPPLPAGVAAAPLRRPDPMTDSDFFTESDADDVLQRGDRRAQVIDGQLYGPAMQPSASVPQLEDSCMESSGIFTDVENRCDEEMRLPELELDIEMDIDMSPDESTKTMRKTQAKAQTEAQAQASNQQQQQQQQRPLSSSSAATLSLSNRTSYCSVKSFCDEAFSSDQSQSQSQSQQRSSGLSVQRATSPRTHASLTSLCTVENSSASSSPKASKSAATTANSVAKPTTPRSAKTPNKWDAVMNKIASNKSTIKTNYNDVKSKVSTTRNMATPPATVAGGHSNNSSNSPSSSVSPRVSPTVRRSPALTPPIVKRSSSIKATPTSSSASMRQPQDKGSVGAGVSVFARLTKSQSPTAASPTTATAVKRLQSAQLKNGRSYSKDSQKSSHSDLSSLCNGNGSGYPKLLAKTPLRTAKKRDVRNLTISPTDLGPPPKTQQTVKGQSTRNKSTTPTPTSIQKRPNGSPPAANAIGSSSSGLKVAAKVPPNAQQISIKNNNTTNKNNCTKSLPDGVAKESLRSNVVDQTELHELNELGHILPTAQTPRDSKRASISNELGCVCGTDNKSCQCAAEKAPKVQRCGSHTPQDLINSIEPNICQPQQQQKDLNPIIIDPPKDEPNLKDATNVISSPIADLPNPAEDVAAQNPILQRFMQNGTLNYDRLARCLEAKIHYQEEKQSQVTGLAIVVQMMSKQMDNLSCKESKTKTSLEETISLLKQTQRSCEELQKQLNEKDMQHQEQEHQQRSELQQAQEKLQEVQMVAKDRYRELEAQLMAKDEEKKQALQVYHQEMGLQLRHKQEQLAGTEQQVLELRGRIRELESQEQHLREKLIRKENSTAIRLSESAQREEQAQEQIKALTKELRTLRDDNAHNERDLRDRLALSQDEISILRHSSQRRSRSPNSSLNGSNAELCRLTSEAESLRCVLELKQAENSTLSKQNAELKREIEEQRRLSNRLTLVEAQNEMLRTELDAKADKEKETQRQLDEVQKAFNYENIKRKRLTCDKEELQYHLKQRSEQLVQLTTQLNELSHSSNDSSIHNISRCNSMRVVVNDESISPPVSPVIKGVIERNDSVSYVLELEEETRQVASKLVRRAGSLRNNSERSPIQRRQLSQSASNGHSSNTSQQHSPNPLSQSMSATALLRNHSHNQEPESPRPLCRARSQSVSNTNDTTEILPLPLPEWDADELRASSPQLLPSAHSAGDMRPRSSTMKLTHKKFQEIQESAGEAMVSGANSEDESCSASSEDMRSSSASSTASLSKRPKQPPSRMSIEEALLLEQANSLNGTPMEVSWSEDAADADVGEGHTLA